MNLMKIGELAEKCGLPVSTIRHYLDLEILKVAEYTDGGQFLFDEKSIKRVEVIKNLSDKGFNLSQIKEQLDAERLIKKIAIIDDDADFAKMVADIIEKTHQGWEVKMITNVFDAGHILVELMPDLVVLDIRLPGVKGYDICKFIKGHDILKLAKVFAVTSYDSKKSKEGMMEVGSDGYMAKPLDIDLFLQKIDELLGIEKKKI